MKNVWDRWADRQDIESADPDDHSKVKVSGSCMLNMFSVPYYNCEVVLTYNPRTVSLEQCDLRPVSPNKNNKIFIRLLN
jgi:hypothetical protein